MKQFRHKKLLIIVASTITFAVIALFLWAGAFVVQIFPRNEPKDPAKVTSSQSLNNGIQSVDYQTLGEVDEKPESTPSSGGAAAADTPGKSAEHLQANAEKTNPGKRRGLLQILLGN